MPGQQPAAAPGRDAGSGAARAQQTPAGTSSQAKLDVHSILHCRVNRWQGARHHGGPLHAASNVLAGIAREGGAACEASVLPRLADVAGRAELQRRACAAGGRRLVAGGGVGGGAVAAARAQRARQAGVAGDPAGPSAGAAGVASTVGTAAPALSLRQPIPGLPIEHRWHLGAAWQRNAAQAVPHPHARAVAVAIQE